LGKDSTQVYAEKKCENGKKSVILIEIVIVIVLNVMVPP
jgi:hypothetical protein